MGNILFKVKFNNTNFTLSIQKVHDYAETNSVPFERFNLHVNRRTISYATQQRSRRRSVPRDSSMHSRCNQLSDKLPSDVSVGEGVTCKLGLKWSPCVWFVLKRIGLKTRCVLHFFKKGVFPFQSLSFQNPF